LQEIYVDSDSGACMPLTALAGIAMDQNAELKVQAAMIEELDSDMDKANETLRKTNDKMKDVLAQAGGTMAVLMRVCMIIVLLALTAYLWKMLS
jgi:hypothetical protein